MAAFLLSRIANCAPCASKPNVAVEQTVDFRLETWEFQARKGRGALIGGGKSMKNSEIERVLAARRTSKVLGDPVKPAPQAVECGEGYRALLDRMLAAAGNAPFHYPSSTVHHSRLASQVPWRVYKIDSANCRKLMKNLIKSGDMSKIPAMLAAAETLLQVTWLPDPPASTEPQAAGDPSPLYEPSLRNMEHIAAAAAMTQSFLLAATGEGYRTYWSSGGPLRSKEVFSQLAIPHGEILLGSIFLFPQDIPDAEIKPGGQRDNRGDISDWSHWCIV